MDPDLWKASAIEFDGFYDALQGSVLTSFLAAILVNVVATNLAHLDLSYNCFGVKGGEAIGASLHANTSLQV